MGERKERRGIEKETGRIETGCLATNNALVMSVSSWIAKQPVD